MVLFVLPGQYGQTPYDVAKQFKRIKVVHLFDDIAGASGAPSTGKKSPVKPAKPTTTVRA